jgi:hypothetical protein
MYEKRIGYKEAWDLTRDMELKLWKIGDWTLKDKIKML